jgi:NAD(P)H-dependent flavin oxidoreductase YrpB (nitropropane dioxygenase family)
MLPTRKGPWALAVLALLCAPVLSGCGGGEATEPSVASAVAHSGILGGLVDGLKREDDEAEAKEERETAPQTREEREEANEQSEVATVQAGMAAEHEEQS